MSLILDQLRKRLFFPITSSLAPHRHSFIFLSSSWWFLSFRFAHYLYFQRVLNLVGWFGFKKMQIKVILIKTPECITIPTLFKHIELRPKPVIRRNGESFGEIRGFQNLRSNKDKGYLAFPISSLKTSAWSPSSSWTNSYFWGEKGISTYKSQPVVDFQTENYEGFLHISDWSYSHSWWEKVGFHKCQSAQMQLFFRRT